VIAVRTDGDPEVGLGHVRRCLALAAQLAPSFEVRFFLEGSEEAAALIRREGFPCDVVSGGVEPILPAVAASRARALVIDSYGATTRDYEAARACAGFLVAIDDGGHYPLPADLVINPAPGVAAPVGGHGAHYLLGPRFALLRREFAAPVSRQVRDQVQRVLLILGGATPGPLSAALARAARRALPEAPVDLVVGPVGDGPSSVAAGLSGLEGVKIHAAPDSVRALMLEADLAITGGGVTLFELAATGTPAIGVELAPNQAPNLAGMAAAGTLILAGKAGDANLEAAVSWTLASLAADAGRRRAMSRRGLELVDGRGAGRVVEAIVTRLADRHSVTEPSACNG